MRRVDEEMRKRERLEAERKQREKELSEQQAEEKRKELEESERLVNFFKFFSFLLFEEKKIFKFVYQQSKIF